MHTYKHIYMHTSTHTHTHTHKTGIRNDMLEISVATQVTYKRRKYRYARNRDNISKMTSK